MPVFHDQKTLPYSPIQVFELVADIGSYQDFLPWCKQSRIIKREGNMAVADLTIAFKGFSSMYTSEVFFIPPTVTTPGEVKAISINGPFKQLTSTWFIAPDPAGSLIDFRVEFTFNSGLLEAMLGGVFTRAQEKLIAAFLERAHTLYG
ncbi:MAG: type II toxin-antitoxin system RatA family toxin [Alphaproteobacteria bacterium]|nr:type II toxin-antitoxin system RatA family toxin [Alphaproteobacteria bacterium]